MLFAFIILLYFVQPAFAYNYTDALDALDAATANIDEMRNAGFNVVRVSDLFTEAKQIFDAQHALEEKTGKADYSLVLQKTDEINSVKDKAFAVWDELKILNTSLNDIRDIDITQAKQLYNQALQEFRNERYEQSKELVDTTYQKLSELESTSAKLAAIYEAGTKTLLGFFLANWYWILGFIAFLIAFWFFYGKTLMRKYIKYKIKKLELERTTLQKLIDKAHRDYFQLGIIPETSFRIKVAKFNEIIRDINRRIPLLEEELKKLK